MARNCLTKARTKYITINEFCEIYLIHKSTVSRYIKQGMPHKKVGIRRTILDLLEVEKWIDQRFN